MITEPLARGDVRTDRVGYLKLIEFYNNCSRYKNEEVLIDFQYLTWIDANMSALFMAIATKLHRENSISFRVDQDLLKTRFNILIRNLTFQDIEVIPNSTGSAIQLTGFTKTDDEKFLQYINESLLGHPNLQLTRGEKNSLRDAFLELFSNVQKHAKTNNPIFACGQYYPTFKRLSFTLVDTGIGYLPPIQRFTKGDISTPEGAILWALDGNTTKKNTPGGLGLKSVKQFCETSGSKFSIITSGAYWHNALSKALKVQEFCGTVVNVIFDCHRL